MRRTFTLVLIALPIMLVLDLAWVGVVANSFYRAQLGYLYAPQTIWQAAAIFYAIYILGFAYFVLEPAVRVHSFKKVLFEAVFFALVAYGTYDLTSLATTTGWPLPMTVVDMLWGVVCAVVTAGATYVIGTRVFKL
ncbi:MAG: DUF2177 family protein [Candidatus Pacebacteria bacterium]|nr:DUF2177 family protein [Candidatus Paceibacterota bacterium]